MEFIIPQPLKAEHNELHTDLANAAKENGPIGEAAKAVAKLLHPHFVKEEDYALPPLGLLSALTKGKITPEMKSVLSMTDRLKAELPEMLEEHRTIVAALEGLSKVAKREKRSDMERFAEKLILHARTEEEVLYPAALLIGAHIETRLGP